MTKRIGELRQRVVLNEPGATTDAMGQQILSFGAPVTRWAHVEEVATPEAQVYDGTTAKRRIVVTLRSPYVGSKFWTEKLRLTYQGTTFDVLSVRTLVQNQTWVELVAEALL